MCVQLKKIRKFTACQCYTTDLVAVTDQVAILSSFFCILNGYPRLPLFDQMAIPAFIFFHKITKNLLITPTISNLRQFLESSNSITIHSSHNKISYSQPFIPIHNSLFPFTTFANLIIHQIPIVLIETAVQQGI